MVDEMTLRASPVTASFRRAMPTNTKGIQGMDHLVKVVVYIQTPTDGVSRDE